MSRRLIIGALVLTISAGGAFVFAQTPGDVGDDPALTATDGYTQADAAEPDRTSSWLKTLRTLGLLVFTTPFNIHDGLGDGPFVYGEVPPTEFGNRPTLQGNGVFLRINGLDSQSCNECHGVVSHATKPPTLGLAGVGGVAQNALPAATVLDIADGFEERLVYMPDHDPDLQLVHDGVADYNGRFINAPFVYGSGGVELLAKEMTRDLQTILHQAQDPACPAGTVYALDTHDTNFGSVTCLGGGHYDLQARGIDDDLVVKPFNRKGENPTIRAFDLGAMQFHFGIQPVEAPGVGWGNDDDQDGVVDELTIFEMSVLHIFGVTNPPPYTQKLDTAGEEGQALFAEIGCSSCHHPRVQTQQNLLPLSYPEIPTDPWENVYRYINLKDFGFDRLPSSDPSYVDAQCLLVPLYSDLKRHDMGDGLKESLEDAGDQANREFITARLWGISDTAPYLHDGRATSLREAIMMHGGEADSVRARFEALPFDDQLNLLWFLRHLRTPVDPDGDLLPVNL